MATGIVTPDNSKRFNAAESDLGKNRNYRKSGTSHSIRFPARKTLVHPVSQDYSNRTSKYFKAMGGESENDVDVHTKTTPLKVDTNNKFDIEESPATPATVASTPRTPANIRGSGDLRSPGVQRTPVARVSKLPSNQSIPDFITQTDANGNATTPRSTEAIEGARKYHPSGPQARLHVDENGNLTEDDNSDSGKDEEDACDTFLENIRMMCCCLMDDHHVKLEGIATEDSDQPVKLLGPMHRDDTGKKCLVLDLDETLVHSSFRAVPNSDFVIPVEIEDVTHLVYVAKRPGVDEFLVEMAKHYEIVIYTASLNKYADPLLDLLDPKKTIRARLFRESCVYYEGNYVKDLSLLNRDLSKTIIIDNAPASYLFHPENAIDCSSFIDDRNDRELDQIGKFLVGIKDSKDVRGLSNRWRDWPVVEER